MPQERSQQTLEEARTPRVKIREVQAFHQQRAGYQLWSIILVAVRGRCNGEDVMITAHSGPTP